MRFQPYISLSYHRLQGTAVFTLVVRIPYVARWRLVSERASSYHWDATFALLSYDLLFPNLVFRRRYGL